MTDKVKIRMLVDKGLYKKGDVLWVYADLAKYFVDVCGDAEYVESGDVGTSDETGFGPGAVR